MGFPSMAFTTMPLTSEFFDKIIDLSSLCLLHRFTPRIETGLKSIDGPLGCQSNCLSAAAPAPLWYRGDRTQSHGNYRLLANRYEVIYEHRSSFALLSGG